MAHGRALGYETLLRAVDPEGRTVGPLQVLSDAARDGDSPLLDSICRGMHVQSFAELALDDVWLFLNLQPRNLAEPSLRQSLLEQLDRSGIPPHRVVVEILETQAHDEVGLGRAVQSVRQLGCLVAIDDFGAGQSNFERLWTLTPDIVKLDRSMVVEAERSSRVRRILPGLVSLIHEAGCLVVVEGIETPEQAFIAMEADADLAQGFLFAEPSARIDHHADSIRSAFAKLNASFQHRTEEQTRRSRESLRAFTEPFERCARRILGSEQFTEACRPLLRVPGVQRCYLLNSSGVQVGENLEAGPALDPPDPRYSPFATARGANWFRRPYFRRAITRPLSVQVSAPYLSMTDARTCVTLSIGLGPQGGHHVLCADLNWNVEVAVPSSPSWDPPPRG
jgi:EAL domain-containing protein (putative c-di-GMP-specific phosphodiesterase class I)